MSTPELPPGIPISDRAAWVSRIHIGVMVPMLLLTSTIFSTRFYLRVWSVWRVDATEVLISVGFLLNLACWCLVLDQMITTPQVLSLSRASRALEVSFFSIPISSWVMTCVRASAALTILRFKSSSLTWKIFLYTLTAIQICFSIAYTAFWLTVCHPLSDWWDLTTQSGNCADTNTIRMVSIMGASINIVNDVLLSVTPVAFIWNLRRPAVERILVCALMGMGSFASIASIIKLVAVLKWSHYPEGDDLWAMAVNMDTWSVAEQSFAVMAACLPFLKPVFHRMLGSVGVRLSVSNSQALTWYRGPQARFCRKSAVIIQEMHDEKGEQSQSSGQASASIPTRDQSSMQVKDCGSKALGP